ncbi:hypothetical protein RUM43_012674 [Polyplax serrata]|uniref:Uncharacterized protein n=1 Tax=Polyplax serrata TaxID=468196 RepID=A0AAN8NYA6_POLSC
MSSVAFIDHLVNQRVAHEIIALEIFTLPVETPSRNKDNFKDHEAIVRSLDVVEEEEEEEDPFTHIITLEDPIQPEDILNVFKFDPQYIENEDKFKALRKEMFQESGESGDGSDESGSEGSDEDCNDEENEDE